MLHETDNKLFILATRASASPASRWARSQAQAKATTVTARNSAWLGSRAPSGLGISAERHVIIHSTCLGMHMC